MGCSIVVRHPFLDGNMRAAHPAMEMFLLMNLHDVVATVDEE